MQTVKEMGIFEALIYFEEMHFDDKEQLVNRTLEEYKVATALDAPKLDAIVIETNKPAGPFGPRRSGKVAQFAFNRL